MDAIDDVSPAAILGQSDALGVRIADLRARADRHRAQEPTRWGVTRAQRRQRERWERRDCELDAEGERLKSELARLRQLHLVALSQDRSTRARPVAFACRHCGQAIHVTQGDVLDGATIECLGCGMKATLEPVVSRGDKRDAEGAID